MAKKKAHTLQVGDVVRVHGGPAIVYKIRRAGTIDCCRVSDGVCFRVSGLTLPPSGTPV